MCDGSVLLKECKSLVSAFLSRAAVTGFRCHGDHNHAIEVVRYPSAVCYGFTLGFKTGNSSSYSIVSLLFQNFQVETRRCSESVICPFDNLSRSHL